MGTTLSGYAAGGVLFAGSALSQGMGLMRCMFASDVQEVYPRIWLGHVGTARDESMLRSLKITHVINVSCAEYRELPDIEYLKMDMLDEPSYDIHSNITQANVFLEKALQDPQSRVFVHCAWGRSRSAAIVLGYMILKLDFSYEDALKILVSKRSVVSPNPGFARQLKSLPPPKH